MKPTHADESLRLSNQLCFPLYAAARRVVGMYTPYLKPLGLTYTQYIVFLSLWEQDGVTVGELGRQLYLDNGTLTPLLKKLESAGYLTRTRDKDDERVVLLTLTEKGRELKNEVADIPEKIVSCIGTNLDESAELYRLLYQLLEAE